MAELFLIAEIAGRRAAIASADVQSVIEVGHVAPVPRAPAFVAGLTALRSRALTVIDARRALGLSASDMDDDGRAVVSRIDGHLYAITVDRVVDVLEAIRVADRPDAELGACWQRVSRGVVETRTGPALVIDLAAIVAGPREAGAR